MKATPSAARGLCVVLAAALAGCSGPAREAPPPVPAGAAPVAGGAGKGGEAKLRFRAQRLPFRYDRGETGDCWPVEVTGGGVGLLDYDGDGDLDLFFAQGGPLRPGAARAVGDVLLRNDRDGAFADVSAASGLSPKGYGQGVTVADYDGDGDPDVYVTRYLGNTLWRNDGGTFTDATAAAGVAGGGGVGGGRGLWSLGAAFFDADGDGDLDLYVANYFDFDPSKAPYARDARGRPRYASPQDFPGQPDVLYRNEGNGNFTDVTPRAGVAGLGRGMGCLATDVDGDGLLDVLVANDAMANALWRNRGGLKFDDVAQDVGLALNGDGLAEANMGIAYADADGDGLPDVAITHFVDERTTLWRRLPDPHPPRGGGGDPGFFDVTGPSGLIPASRPVTGWGVAFADFDADGRPDLVQTNGHILDEPDRTFPYANPPTLWRNVGGGRFRDVTADAGPYFRELHQGRGLAAGDLDGDGDLDLVVVHHHAPSVVLWNETEAAGRSLTLRLRGKGRNRDAIGTRVTAKVGGSTLVRTVDGGGGYLSTGDPAVHLGLGSASKADRVEVRWPSGLVEARTDLPVGGVVEWREGSPPR